MFIVALWWKPPKYQLAKEWRNRMWHIYTMKYYSTVKEMKLMI